MLGKAFSSTGGAPKVPVEVRRQQLADAEQKFGSMFPGVSDINAREANTLLQQKPEQYVLVDCRNKEEQQVSMLPGSRVVTLEEFETQCDRYKDVTAICYCTVGYRSSQFASSLQDKGRQAVNLQGGIVAWTHEGLPLVDGSDRQQATNKVHTYAEEWAYQADGYEPVYYVNSNLVLLRDALTSLKRSLMGG